jgi:SAM-dependent methyltransferase
VRLGLAGGNALSVSIFDISARVIDHIQRVRQRARKNVPNTGYVIQLPRDVARPWPPDLVAYWRSLGDRVGSSVAPITPPNVFQGLETRAVRIRPEVVLACEPLDLNIVLERIHLEPADRFDLVIGTNIFLYYGAFEQTLALENAGAMLKPGGLLLTNDRLPEVRGGLMRLAGATEVRYDDRGAREAVGWYQKR